MYGIFMQCWVAFKDYGRPALTILFLASAIYLIVTEKELYKKILFGILPLVIVAGFLLPITKILYVKLPVEDPGVTYYRVLWLIPMYITIGYGICKLIMRLSKEAYKYIALVAAVLVIAGTGSFVYTSRYMSKAENLYHIPQVVIDICEEITHGGTLRTKAAFSGELTYFVRQYYNNIMMPFGREYVEYQWDYAHPVYDAMEKPFITDPDAVIDAKALVEATREEDCEYIILRKDRKTDEDLTTLGLMVVDEIGDYIIYEDLEVVAEKNYG